MQKNIVKQCYFQRQPILEVYVSMNYISWQESVDIV